MALQRNAVFDHFHIGDVFEHPAVDDAVEIRKSTVKRRRGPVGVLSDRSVTPRLELGPRLHVASDDPCGFVDDGGPSGDERDDFRDAARRNGDGPRLGKPEIARRRAGFGNGEGPSIEQVIAVRALSHRAVGDGRAHKPGHGAFHHRGLRDLTGEKIDVAQRVLPPPLGHFRIEHVGEKQQLGVLRLDFRRFRIHKLPRGGGGLDVQLNVHVPERALPVRLYGLAYGLGFRGHQPKFGIKGQLRHWFPPS